jgi:HEAT repeats/PBS lyase HEAT-like repeat
MTEQHGRDRVVTLRIDGLPGDVTSHIRERLQETVRPANIFSTASADTLTIHMAPVGDIQAVADKIDFGTVHGVDGAARIVRVKADATKLPAPLPPAVTNPRDGRFYQRNLEDLDSWDAGRRRESATRLRDAPPATGTVRASIAAALRRRLKEDADSHTRAAAAAALATWTEPENAQALVAALKDSDLVVRRQVLEALGKLKDPSTAPAVAAMLPESRHDAAACLKAMGPAAEDAVLPYLKHADHWVRMEAAKVLGDVGTDKSLPGLRELSESRDGLAPGAAKQAMEAIRKRHGAP